ncbi:hypothetical protein SAMN02746065_10451 [Desulfocicer vacuolatum DSM 3385]|uniref:Uncharacterized protein n=1 Tax=Desulfocicer vacuolatum DSM 3385 TaxID=1121400 RepID=A0A1W2A307_9BACT|nr:hypothetical protein SAMN02746065_10451 [Desulfocicer vacuolatum DSM 3385]
MKKILNILLITAVLIPFLFSPAWAGSRNKHLLETVIIGTGVAILGTALIHEVHHNNKKHAYAHNSYNNQRKYSKHSRHRERHPSHCRKHRGWNKHKKRGHMVMEKVWVGPVYRNKWKPGHYNRRGRWVKGHYKQILIREGYWEKRQVWARSDR